MRKIEPAKVFDGEERYGQSMKKAFNENCSKKPKAFIKPKTANEICDVLQYASDNHIQVSVLGGGHDPKGKACGNLLVLQLFTNSTTQYQ